MMLTYEEFAKSKAFYLIYVHDLNQDCHHQEVLAASLDKQQSLTPIDILQKRNADALLQQHAKQPVQERPATTSSMGLFSHPQPQTEEKSEQKLEHTPIKPPGNQ